MAMTLRLPADLDAALQVLADAQSLSKQALVIRAVEELVNGEAKADLVMASVERTLLRDAGLFTRLEDA